MWRKGLSRLVREDPYFGEHPDHCGAWDGGDPLGRPVVWALKKGSGRRTVVFSGHYDTVDTACYGVFEPYALSPDALRKAMLDAPPADEELRRDLADENWMFGRGCADMKAGLALNLNALYEYCPGEVNVLFTAVSDEENLSAGARQAVGLYSLLQERFDLEYAIAVVSEPSERDVGADAPHPIINGSAGKILPVVVARGIPAHSASMLRGLNSAHLIANIIRETEYDTAFLSQGGNLFTEPPAVQLVRDLKAGYDVSMPEYTAAAFNMTFFCGTDPVELMNQLLHNCKVAADDLLERYSACMDDMERTGRIGPDRRKHFGVRVLTLEELEAELCAQSGYEAYRREAKARSARLVASGETLLWASICYIRDIMAFAGGGPIGGGGHRSPLLSGGQQRPPPQGHRAHRARRHRVAGKRRHPRRAGGLLPGHDGSELHVLRKPRKRAPDHGQHTAAQKPVRYGRRPDGEAGDPHACHRPGPQGNPSVGRARVPAGRGTGPARRVPADHSKHRKIGPIRRDVYEPHAFAGPLPGRCLGHGTV